MRTKYASPLCRDLLSLATRTCFCSLPLAQAGESPAEPRTRPDGLIASPEPGWPHWLDPSYEHHAFVRGPDGLVWTWLKDVLARIAPNDASVHVVGMIDPVGWPTFVGLGLYLSGSERLRHIRHIASTP